MDKQNAERLLSETFNNDFSMDNFSKFIKELFNEFKVEQKDCTKYIATEYREYISSLIKLGNYDVSGKSIEVLVVKLNKSSSRDRARTMQRNFIANWLGKTEKDAALVAFYDEDPHDWRFSFVKMEYALAKDEKGEVKISKELTPAKRYSFLVGVNEPNHTCKSQFLRLVMEEETNPSLEEIEQAFGIENVTKEFFLKYKELFLELEEFLRKVIEANPSIKKEFEGKNILTVDFAKKLLGQIVFIYFLQKKGWLGVARSEDGSFRKWGTGAKNFLRKLFDKEVVPYNNFFNDILEPLFYEALATERDNDYYSRFNCKIPFLNGGLFEPINDYDWAGTEIHLQNAIFEKILNVFDTFNFTVKEDEPLEKEVAVDPEMLGKVFENLLDVKDRKSKGAFYTPREIVHYMCQQSLINYLETNTSLPRKDIEMFIQLGDFANTEDLRYMQEIKKLNEEILSGRKTDTMQIQKEIQEHLSKLTLPKSIVSDKVKIDKLLAEIKAVDPAVGSGAFLVGMMTEIVKARDILSVYFPGKDKNRTYYELKRETIENCLYGVDIEPSAVDITKLRFWLSLIVDELDMKNIKPLPNLDHKIMCGNSLLEEFEGIKLFDGRLLGEVKNDYLKEVQNINLQIKKLYQTPMSEEVNRKIKELEKEKTRLGIESKKDKTTSQITLDLALEKRIKESQKKLSELKLLQKKFFNEQNRKIKKQLREDIDRIEWELIEETLKEQGNEQAMQKLAQYQKNKSKPFFLWKLYFSEVFQRENPGFDVVIGNPPYIKIQSLEKETVQVFNREYSCATGKYDIYVLFVEKGFSIMRQSGVISYIHPHRFLKVDYGVGLREYLINNRGLNKFLYFGTNQVFDTATTYTGVFFYKNNSDSIQYLEAKDLNLHNLVFNSKKYGVPNFNWSFINRLESEILSKIQNQKNKIKTFFEGTYQGVITVGDDIFILKGKIKNELFLGYSEASKSEVIIESELLKPLLKGEHIRRYVEPRSEIFLFYPHYNDASGKTRPYEELELKTKYPLGYQYIIQFKDGLIKKKISYKTNSQYWFSLHRPREKTLFEQIKILTPQLQNYPNFTIDENNFYPDAGGYSLILSKDKREYYKCTLAILNSKMLWYFIVNTSTPFNNGYYYFKTTYLEPFGFPNISQDRNNELTKLVDQIRSITKDSNYLNNPEKQVKVKQLEKEIDALVYKLYDLTPEEIKIVEEFGG